MLVLRPGTLIFSVGPLHFLAQEAELDRLIDHVLLSITSPVLLFVIPGHIPAMAEAGHLVSLPIPFYILDSLPLNGLSIFPVLLSGAVSVHFVAMRRLA